MKITFLKAKRPLAKEITSQGSKPYPLVKDFTSYEEDVSVDKKGFNKLFRALCTAASEGACMLKGPLKRPIVDESRAFMSDRSVPTELLVIDIDGLRAPAQDLRAMADRIVLQLPDIFHDVSYIVQASASLGIVQDRTSFSPQVKKVCSPNKLKPYFIILFNPGSDKLYSFKKNSFS